jgi:hypothetical protein
LTAGDKRVLISASIALRGVMMATSWPRPANRLAYSAMTWTPPDSRNDEAIKLKRMIVAVGGRARDIRSQPSRILA